jgi:hypothetical protein
VCTDERKLLTQSVSSGAYIGSSYTEPPSKVDTKLTVNQKQVYNNGYHEFNHSLTILKLAVKKDIMGFNFD